MRKLTAGQKKAIERIFIKYYNENRKAAISIDDFPYHDVVLPIDNMNPCEVFWQNANRFIDDLRSSPKYSYMLEKGWL